MNACSTSFRFLSQLGIWFNDSTNTCDSRDQTRGSLVSRRIVSSFPRSWKQFLKRRNKQTKNQNCHNWCWCSSKTKNSHPPVHLQEYRVVHRSGPYSPRSKVKNLCNQIWSKNGFPTVLELHPEPVSCQTYPQLQWDVDVIDKYIMQTIC